MTDLRPTTAGSLPDRLDALVDTATAVLGSAAVHGWSPVSAGAALDVIDVLAAALAQHGGPLADVLSELPDTTAAARPAARLGGPSPRAG